MFDEIYMDHKVKFGSGVAFFPYDLDIEELYLLKKIAEKRNFTISIRRESAYKHGTFEVRVVPVDYPEILQNRDMEIIEKKFQNNTAKFLEHRSR